MKSRQEAIVFVIIVVVAVGIVAAVLVPPWLKSRREEAARLSQALKLQKGLAALLVQGGHVRGNPKAPYTLVMISDYQCGQCARSASVVEEQLEKYGDKMKLVFHAIQISSHYEYAFLLARAAEAAGLQGKYWEMHDLIYANQERLLASAGPEEAKEQLAELALKAGLDTEKFLRDTDSEVTAKLQAKDQEFSDKAAVKRTPTYYFVTPGGEVAQIGMTPEMVTFLAKPENWR